MSEKFFDNNFVKIHFIGVGGVSTSAIAKRLLERRYKVFGSDITYGDNAYDLERLGAKITCGHSARNVRGADAVVYTSAVDDGNCELRYAKRKKIPIFKRAELLGEIVAEYKNSVGVSGSHGKTTATAMIANALIKAGKDPTVFLGGDSPEYGNYRSGKGDSCVVEACEYKKNFLYIKPKIAVVLNIDKDHVDSYSGMDDMTETFGKFVRGTLSVVNADDAYCTKIFHSATVTFGIHNLATYSAKNIKFNGKGYSFTACAYSRPLGRVNLSVMGKHNIYNALATVAVCDILKIPFGVVAQSLENFSGVKRRCEYIGEFYDSAFYADYAHHPKEIAATLEAFAEAGEPFAVIFQPHTYSRTKALMQDFVSALSANRDTVVYSTYPAREEFDAEGSAKTLYDNLVETARGNFYYAVSPVELEKVVKGFCGKYRTVIFLGAGDVYEVAKSMVENNAVGATSYSAKIKNENAKKLF